MRYIGGKTLLTDEIINLIQSNTHNISSIIDVFSGSGSVSKALKSKGYRVISNDFLYFSYVLNRGTLPLRCIPKFNDLPVDDPLQYLNNLTLDATPYHLNDCFIFKNYSPNSECNRMYFQNNNAIKIDLIRRQIEDWKPMLSDDEYYYLLSALIAAVPFVSNIAGVYGAYLKHWDKRSYQPLQLETPDLIYTQAISEVYNLNCNDFLPRVSADVLYADPPYNSRQYLPNYHVLETIARYDAPTLKGITGMRNYDNQKSEFCIKNKVSSAFKRMIELAKVKYVIISYNNEGLLSTKELSDICMQYAKKNSFELIEIDYRRYKSKIPNSKTGLKEQLYYFEKR